VPKNLRVTQVKSVSDKGQKQRATMRALGIRRIGQAVTQEDKPEIRGMIRVVEHLVTVEEIDA
jgi:large subunit ribosomal protein L30